MNWEIYITNTCDLNYGFIDKFRLSLYKLRKKASGNLQDMTANAAREILLTWEKMANY